MAPVTCPDTTCREVADPHPLLHVSLCHVERIYGVYGPQPFTRSHKSFTHHWRSSPTRRASVHLDADDRRYDASMRTTITLDEGLLRRAKERAASQGKTLSDVISDSLQVLLAEQPQPRHKITLPTFGGSGFQPGVDLEDKEALAVLLEDGDRAAC